MGKELVLNVVVRKEGDRYSSWCPELDVASDGSTIEDAKTALKEAVQCHIEAMIDNNDMDLLAEKLGIEKKDFDKKIIIPETFSSTFEVPLFAQ